MRRVIARLLLSAILGLIISVGVAWACALFLEEPLRRGAIPAIGETREGDMYWWIQREQVPGRLHFRSYFAPNAARENAVSSSTQAAVVAPSWFDPRESLASNPAKVDADVDVYGYGWPRICLFVQLVKVAPQGLPGPNWEGDSFPRGGWRPTQRTPPHEALPTAPIAAHLAINTGFYGSLIFFLLTLGFTLRRANRFRQGRCPDCRYDLQKRFAAGCPECGWNRKGA